MPGQPPPRRPVAVDALDVILGYATLCAGFAISAALGVSSSARPLKYVLAVALVAALGARRAVLGPPRAATVQSRTSALGILGAACLLVGLILGSFGGYLLFQAYTTRAGEPERIDRDAIEQELGLGSFRTCTRDGEPAHGRACMTEEERAQEAREDAATYAAERARLAAEEAAHRTRYWQLTGVGTGLVVLGAWLDLRRGRRGTSAG